MAPADLVAVADRTAADRAAVAMAKASRPRPIKAASDRVVLVKVVLDRVSKVAKASRPRLIKAASDRVDLAKADLDRADADSAAPASEVPADRT